MGVLHADAVGRTDGVLAEAAQLFAVPTREIRRALAMVGADLIDALAAIYARAGQAFVQVQLAVLALEARRTMADVGAVVIVTHPVVQTRVRQTLVDVRLAIGALVTGKKEKGGFVGSHSR